ncbi:hypothetical protein LXA43DRAFT_222807 [Ganoderma leucocontextum]|nr:hypothetical protein LXA43DRAFT_222807 [Ganoderma leucocontextum]
MGAARVAIVGRVVLSASTIGIGYLGTGSCSSRARVPSSAPARQVDATSPVSKSCASMFGAPLKRLRCMFALPWHVDYPCTSVACSASSTPWTTPYSPPPQ